MKVSLCLLLLFTVIFVVRAEDNDFSSPSYNALNRAEKFEKIWSKVTANTTPNGWYSKLEFMQMLIMNMKTSFDHISDMLPDGRKKLIHSVGVTGLVSFEAIQDQSINPYTGIFKGCSHVVLRLSLAGQPDETKKTATEADDNYKPGFGIKFLRDGVHSGNLVAMYSTSGQPSWNFFKNEFSNHIPPAQGLALKIFELKFRTASSFTNKVGVKDLARYGEDGKDYSNNLNFPYKLIFRPTPEATALYHDYFTEYFVTNLQKIPVDMTIYDLYVTSAPNADPVKIGSLKVRQAFTSSHWGDEKLFFRHGYMEDDYAFHPEWSQLTSDHLKLLQDPEFKDSFREAYGFEHP